MNPFRLQPPVADLEGDVAGPLVPAPVPQLVAAVYETAPPAERGRLLEQLLQPLGLLSLAGIAGGIFASIRLRSGWRDLSLSFDDIQNVRGFHVAALVEHAQQISIETVDGLAQLLMASPVMSGTAGAALLVAVLLQRARARGHHQVIESSRAIRMRRLRG